MSNCFHFQELLRAPSGLYSRPWIDKRNHRILLAKHKYMGLKIPLIPNLQNNFVLFFEMVGVLGHMASKMDGLY